MLYVCLLLQGVHWQEVANSIELNVDQQLKERGDETLDIGYQGNFFMKREG
jgi:hypothetical protein